ncbi:MAG: DUF4910 domain-containing protein [Syntrophales bacterium]
MKNKLRFDFMRSYDLCAPGKDLSGDEEVRFVMKICEDIYMLNRTLVSDGYDEALSYLGRIWQPVIHEVASGTSVWTWTIPRKWKMNKATIRLGSECICDARKHPLYLASYSVPFAGRLTRKELLEHVYTEPDRPHAIPYRYHYYKAGWSFCLPFSVVRTLPEGDYDVEVDTEFTDGTLKVGEWILPGKSEQSIIFSSHLCHPAQVNDGLIGAAVGLCIMRGLAAVAERRYTYRLIVHPENIGSLCYFFRNPGIARRAVGAVFLEMLGNKNHIKMQKSRQGDTVIDSLMETALDDMGKPFGMGEFRQVIANDEININGPGIDIPCISITRWPYPEYHTSDDNPGIMSMEKIRESIDLIRRFIFLLENNYYPARKYVGNLFLSRFGLYENLNESDTVEKILLSFEGKRSILEISRDLSLDFDLVLQYAKKFHEQGLVTLGFEPGEVPGLDGN